MKFKRNRDTRGAGCPARGRGRRQSTRPRGLSLDSAELSGGGRNGPLRGLPFSLSGIGAVGSVIRHVDQRPAAGRLRPRGDDRGLWLIGRAGAFWQLARAAASGTRIVGAAVASSLVFFLVTNLAVWSAWYPHTTEGLARCFVRAIPFFINTLAGDLLFAGGLFGLYRLATAAARQRNVSSGQVADRSLAAES